MATALALALSACGESEHTFTAQEFIKDANRHGAQLRLGQQLTASDPSAKLYAVSSKGTPPPPTGGAAAGAIPEGSSGTVRITDSADAAKGEFTRCENAGTLLCFRAANVVVLLESEFDRPAVIRLSRALRDMQSG